jgi:predicted nucleic acid-binding protein
MNFGKVIAVLDANVLYPTTLRDLLIWLAVNETFDAHWTLEITQEWVRNLLKDRSDISASRLERTLMLMENALPDAKILGYEQHLQKLSLPDEKDCHVLAAAIEISASVIVTQNLRDFPASVLEPHSIVALHPDNFICALIEINPFAVLKAIAEQRANFKNPPLTLEEYLERLSSQGLARFVLWLRTRLTA